MTAIQFVVTVILARLLTPTEVGIFSITAVFIGFAAVFRDFGISGYLQSEKDLTTEKIRSALGVIITSAWILAAGIYFASDYVAAFYKQPGIGSVMRVLSISFAMVPLASYYHSLLARNMQAGKEAMVNACGTLAYATTCITLAWLGFSYMSLAWANVANVTVTICAYIYMRAPGTPSIPSFRGWSGPIRFGGGAVFGSVADQLYASIPDLFLGKMNGAHDVGIYSRANGLVGIFNQIIGPAIGYSALPHIAKNHHANEPLGEMMAKATNYLTGLAWPAFIITAIFAKELLNVLYGPQWIAAAPIVMFICFQNAARIGYSLTRPALMAIGKPYLPALASGAGAICRMIAILLFGSGDLPSFALALCIADFVSLAIPMRLLSNELGYSFRMAMAAFWPSLKVSTVFLVLALVVRYAMPPAWPDIIKLMVSFTLMGAVWVALIIFFRHALCNEFGAFLGKLLPASLLRRMKKTGLENTSDR